MISLKKVFEDLFEDRLISFLRLKAGTERHINLTIASNIDGTFTAMLVETQNAYTEYFGFMAGIDQGLLVQKSKTAAKNTLETTFLKESRKLEGLVISIFEENSTEYNEAFPYGLTEYNDANDPEKTILMERLKLFTAAHIADFGQPKADLFAAIKLNYDAAVSVQGQKIGAVGSVRTERHASRKELTVQLTKNVHTVGEAFPTNVDRCMDFFDQSKFLPRGNASEAFLVDVSENEGDVKEIVAPAGFNGSAASQLTIAITTPNPMGKKIMIFSGNLPTDMPLPTQSVIITEGTAQTVTFAAIGLVPGKKLFGRNIGMGAVDFEVEFIA